MFGPHGHIYVYRSYGLHWCLNIVAGSPGSAVLVRALEPDKGLTEMSQRRGTDNIRLLCSGPGRLCQALGITGEYNGGSVLIHPFHMEMGPHQQELVAGPRIGISRGMDSKWRFGLRQSPFLSRPFPSVGQDVAP